MKVGRFDQGSEKQCSVAAVLRARSRNVKIEASELEKISSLMLFIRGGIQD